MPDMICTALKSPNHARSLLILKIGFWCKFLQLVGRLIREAGWRGEQLAVIDNKYKQNHALSTCSNPTWALEILSCGQARHLFWSEGRWYEMGGFCQRSRPVQELRASAAKSQPCHHSLAQLTSLDLLVTISTITPVPTICRGWCVFHMNSR